MINLCQIRSGHVPMIDSHPPFESPPTGEAEGESLLYRQPKLNRNLSLIHLFLSAGPSEAHYPRVFSISEMAEAAILTYHVSAQEFEEDILGGHYSDLFFLSSMRPRPNRAIYPTSCPKTSFFNSPQPRDRVPGC